MLGWRTMILGTKIALIAIGFASLLVSAPAAVALETRSFEWPAGLNLGDGTLQQPLERGPSAAFPEGDAVWIHDNRGHSFLRLSLSGEVLARIPSPGFVQSFVILADGAIASLDQTRRRIFVQEPDGSARHEVPLPAGLTKARRLVEVDGVLVLQTAMQESFVVPLNLDSVSTGSAAAQRRIALRHWFLSRREGLLFPGAKGRAAAITVSEGRATLLTYAPRSGLSVGEKEPRRVTLAAVPGLRAADIVGAAAQGWWIRLTTGGPSAAVDHVALVTNDGAIQWRATLPDASAYSWVDRLWPSSRIRGGAKLGEAVLHLRPDAQGLEQRLWRRP
jgi:hypothetical protein